MLADLGHPPPAAVASALGVNLRTVRRWIAADLAPRPAMLALYWMTRWGQSQIECEAVNDARIAAENANSHAAISAARLSALEHLLSVGDFGAANAPLMQPHLAPASPGRP